MAINELPIFATRATLQELIDVPRRSVAMKRRLVAAKLILGSKRGIVPLYRVTPEMIAGKELK